MVLPGRPVEPGLLPVHPVELELLLLALLARHHVLPQRLVHRVLLPLLVPQAPGLLQVAVDQPRR